MGGAVGLPGQPAAARGLISTARLVLLVTWAVYPIAYAVHGDALDGAVPGLMRGTYEQSVVGIQVGCAVADILAKAGFGVLIYLIAVRKTEALHGAERPDTAAGRPAAALA